MSQLDCSICLEPYSDAKSRKPRLLLCGHTFCTTCLKAIIVTKQAQPGAKGKKKIQPGQKYEKSVNCPNCRQPSAVGKGSAEAFKVNFALAEVISGSRTEVVVCDDCDDPKAQVWCGECSVAFCLECADRNHQTKYTKKHARVPLKDKPANLICGDHQERFHFFCLTCSEPVCYICKDPDHGKHGKHKTALISTVEQDQIKILNEKKAELDGFAESLQEISGNVAQVIINLDTNEQKHYTEINQNIDMFIDNLNKRRAELLVELANQVQVKRDALSNQRQDLASSIAAIVASSETVKQTLQQTKLKLLTKLRPVTEKVQGVLADAQQLPKNPVKDAYIGCALQGQTILDEVKLFGYIGVLAPAAPREACASDVTDSTAVIDWNSQKDVQEYSVELSEEKQDKWRVYSKPQLNRQKLSNLRSETFYQIRISALNQGGAGAPSDPVTFTTKKRVMMFSESTLMSDDECETLKGWVPKSGRPCKLLCKASQHGWGEKPFHDRVCKNNAPSVVVIKRKDSDRVYGCYISKPLIHDKKAWTHDEGKQGFVFTFKDNTGSPKKYPMETLHLAYHDHNRHGLLWFGASSSVGISVNANASTDKNCGRNKSTYPSIGPNELTGAEQGFLLDDFEVFSC